MSCTEQEKTQATNIQVVRRLNTYLNQHNWKAMTYCYADTVQLKDTTRLPYAHSKEMCVSRHRRLWMLYPDLKQRITQLYAAGNHHVVMETILEGTTPSGILLRQAGCVIYTIERQRITKESSYQISVISNQ